MRDFTHEGAIHEVDLVVFVDLNRFVTLGSAFGCLLLEGFSDMISVDALTRGPCCFEATRHGLSQSVWFCLVGEYVLCCSLRISFVAVFG